MVKNRPIAVFCGDLHLTLNPPACRKEKDWLEVQAGYLKQLRDLAGYAPVLCCGDLFDKWNPMPELIHFALEHLPDGMICIPGNHDLPNGLMSQKHRSAYGVIAKAGKIDDVSCGRSFNLDSADLDFNLTIYGFGCNEVICKPEGFDKDGFNIALVHRYVWEGRHKYPGAPKEAHIFNISPEVHYFDAVAVSDNHDHFMSSIKSLPIINIGTFIRRKTDEIKYTPSVGILLRDGTVETHRLDTSKDQFHESTHKGETMLDVSKFIHELKELGEHGLDFRAAVENHLKSEDISPEVKQIILEALA